jgi:hypothetical protein
MSATSYITTASVTNTCTCEVFDEETFESVPASECWGDCFEESRRNFEDAVQAWATKRAVRLGFIEPYIERDLDLSAFHFTVYTRAMGWDKREATAVTDGDALLDLLSLSRAEYRLDLLEHEGKLSVMRYSHDEPTGASFALDLTSVNR